MKICVLIPALNEEKEIGRIVTEVRAKGIDVIVIDDGSMDQTGSIAKSNGAMVFRNDQRHGKGFSLKRGFAYILEQGYDGVITMDGDGQHASEDIDHFIVEAQGKNMCLINGTRMGDPKGMPFVRRATNRFMSWLISCLCRQRIEDTQCGFRYVSADILRQITLVSNDFEIETEMLMKSCRTGCRVVSVPIQTIYRDEKSKIRPIKDTFRFVAYLWRELC